MFGGLSFMVDERMAVAADRDGDLLVHSDPADYDYLLRQYLPKRSDLSTHNLEALTVIADELNGRPRKALDWDTPAERMAALLDTTETTHPATAGIHDVRR